MSSTASIPARSSGNTLLVVVRSGCRYCDASMDFYKRLLASPAKEAVLFVSSDPVGRTTQYLAGHGIADVPIAAVAAGALKIPGTPSLLMIDPTRRIQGVWVGKLSPDQEEEVLRHWSASE